MATARAISPSTAAALPGDPRRYVFALLIIAILPMAVLLAARDAAGEWLMERLIVDADYVQAIRNSDLACRTLRMRRADVVIVGDSHNYAGWDFAQFERRLGARTGGCMLGGLYEETVPTVLAALGRLPHRPRMVILGVSPRMFWDSPTRRAQIAANLDVIREIDAGDLPTFDLARTLLAARGQSARTAEAIAARANNLATLDLGVVRRRLDGAGSVLWTRDIWVDRLRDTEITASARAAVDAICATARRLDLPLWVVHVPESPYLESLYPAGAWARYVEVLAGFEQCVERTRILAQPAQAYDLTDRDYVDRLMEWDPSYAAWHNDEPLRDARIFDFDHMNPLGAQRFTDMILARIVRDDPMAQIRESGR